MQVPTKDWTPEKVMGCFRCLAPWTYPDTHICAPDSTKPVKPVIMSQCDICLKLMTHVGNLKAHRRLHLGEKPFICSYEGCDKMYSDQSGLRKHQTAYGHKADGSRSSSRYSPYEPKTQHKREQEGHQTTSLTQVPIVRPLQQVNSLSSFVSTNAEPHLASSCAQYSFEEIEPRGLYGFEGAAPNNTSVPGSCFPHISFEDSAEPCAATPYGIALPNSSWECHQPYHSLEDNALFTPDSYAGPFLAAGHNPFPMLATGIDVIDFSPLYNGDSYTYTFTHNHARSDNPEYNLRSDSSSASSVPATPSERGIPYYSDCEPPPSPLTTHCDPSHFPLSVFPIHAPPSRIFSSH